MTGACDWPNNNFIFRKQIHMQMDNCAYESLQFNWFPLLSQPSHSVVSLALACVLTASTFILLFCTNIIGYSVFIINSVFLHSWCARAVLITDSSLLPDDCKSSDVSYLLLDILKIIISFSVHIIADHCVNNLQTHKIY